VISVVCVGLLVVFPSDLALLRSHSDLPLNLGGKISERGINEHEIGRAVAHCRFAA
jgi:hypothetical protein